MLYIKIRILKKRVDPFCFCKGVLCYLTLTIYVPRYEAKI